MTGKNLILTCTDATRPYWQLGPLPPATGAVTLIGWKSQPEPIECGIPPEIASVLARSFASIGWVSFLSSDVQGRKINAPTNGDTKVRQFEARSWSERAKALIKREPAVVHLVATRDADVVAHLFNDPEYSWCQQAQMALLSPAEVAPPELDRRELLRAITFSWDQNVELLKSAGILVLIKPGVDGDLAGAFTWSQDAQRSLLASLRKEAEAARLMYREVSEREFEQILASD